MSSLALFRDAGMVGTDKELATTVNAYHGHALSLSLLATYLREYENGDIRKQDGLLCLTEFPEETRTSRHAFRVMAAYERQLVDSADVQVLYSLGLFDRPVSAGAMICLRESGIPQVGGPPNDKIFHAACKRLRRLGLLNREDTEHPGNLDCHPLVRQYFGKRLEELHPESWQQAHARLYEYFKTLPEKEQPNTLEKMEPLFAAVRHGCAAGMHQKAKDEVYWPRILRKNEHYLPKKICAFADELSVLVHFFAVPWSMPAAGLTDYDKAVVLNSAAFSLRALGRLTEAKEPMQASGDMLIKQKKWGNSAIAASNLSELYLTVGDLAQAVAAGRQSVELADRSGDILWRMASRTALADALHQGGELAEATALFAEAEKMQQERQQGCDWLDSVQGFQYCDLLLASDAWPEVRRRVKKTLHWAKQDGDLLGIALDKLSLGRTASHKAIEQAGLPALSSLAPDLACVLPPGKAVEPVSGAVEAISRAVKWLNQAVDGLREAGDEELIARGLLARATRYRWAIVLLNQSDAITQALQDLQETEEIAQRSGMKLHLIDFHLEAARLALTVGKPVLNRTAIEHLTAAKKGIKETGYNRRLPEVANIEELL